MQTLRPCAIAKHLPMSPLIDGGDDADQFGSFLPFQASFFLEACLELADQQFHCLIYPVTLVSPN
jgi:hypothetical protein